MSIVPQVVLASHNVILAQGQLLYFLL